MNSGNGSQGLCMTIRKVSSVDNGYNWNYMTIDGYSNYEDLLAPKWKASTVFPVEVLDKVNSMMENGVVYK